MFHIEPKLKKVANHAVAPIWEGELEVLENAYNLKFPNSLSVKIIRTTGKMTGEWDRQFFKGHCIKDCPPRRL